MAPSSPRSNRSSIRMSPALVSTLISLTLLSVLVTPAAAQCFTPNGTDINKAYGKQDYQPCYPSDNKNQASMCCATNRGTPDTCRSDGLCLSGDGQSVYRESCTDPTWQSPSCVKLCAGLISDKVPGGDEIVTVCPSKGDEPPTYCCGGPSVGTDCCRKKQGVYLLPDGTTSSVNPSTGSSNGNSNSGSTMDNTNSAENSNNKQRTAALAGGVVAVIVLISSLAILAYILYRRRTRGLYPPNRDLDRYSQLPPEMRGPVRKHSFSPTSTFSESSSVADGLHLNRADHSRGRFGSEDSTTAFLHSASTTSPPTFSPVEVPAPPARIYSLSHRRSRGRNSRQKHELPTAHNQHELSTDHVRHMLGLTRSHSHAPSNQRPKTPRIEVTEVPRSVPAFFDSSNEAHSLRAGLGTRDLPVEIGDAPSIRDSTSGRSDVSGSLTSLKKTLDKIGTTTTTEGRRKSGMLSPVSPTAGWKKRTSKRISMSRQSSRQRLMLDKPVPAPPLPPPASRPAVSRQGTTLGS